MAELRAAGYAGHTLVTKRVTLEQFARWRHRRKRPLSELAESQIQAFVGATANAVCIQIRTALIAVLIVRYLQFRSSFRWAVANLMALLRWNVFSDRNL